MYIKKTNKIENALIKISGALLPLPLLSFRGISLGIALLSFITIINIVRRKKACFNKHVFVIMLLSITTMLLSLFNEWDSSWKGTSVYNTLLFCIICIDSFAVFYNKEKANALIDGLKIACIIQIIWSIIQFALYWTYNIDINNIVFSNLLHVKENSTHYGYGILSVSGLGWHPAQLAPIIVLSYLCFPNIFVKILLVFITIISRNSTCTVVLMTSFIIDYIYRFSEKKSISKKKLVTMLCIIVAVIVIVYNLDKVLLFVGTVLGSNSSFFRRIEMIAKGNITDLSTNLHIRYYTEYFPIISKSGVLKFLFGYGFQCSGYPFTIFYNQYTTVAHWTTETDIINFLLGRGIIWTALFYWFIISTLRKAIKTTVEAILFIVPILIGGIFYDIQFDWVVLLEFVFYLCVKRKEALVIFNTKRNNEALQTIKGDNV